MNGGGDIDQGEQPFRIGLIDIRVTDDDIDWDVYEDWSVRGSFDRRGRGTLELSPQLVGAITLLADLLQFHSDQDKSDKISNTLYKDLLTVVGQQLFSLLFVDNLRNEVAQTLGKLRDGHLELLRIKLWFSGKHESWLAGLPWEYVRTPAGDPLFDPRGVFLSQHAELVLSRRVESPTMRRLGQEQKGFTVLLVSPNPNEPELDSDGKTLSDSHLDPVDPGKVVECLQDLADAGLINFEPLVDTPPEHPEQDYRWVTRKRLRDRMKQEPKPVLVHFLGHGRSNNGHGELLFSSENGAPDWVDDELFTGILGKSQVLKLVFLQACESASAPTADQYISFSGVARHLAASGIPAVVGMQYRIKAELATAFAGAFYDALIRHNTPVDRAVEAGRQAIEDVHDDRDRLAFGLPVLYLTADHEGMAAGGTAHGVAVLRGDPLERRPCPRCETSLEPNDRACRNCGLKLRCVNEECEEKPFYPDPLRDRFCAQCSAPANQPQWAPDEVSGIDRVVASAAATSAASGVLSVMRPGR